MLKLKRLNRSGKEVECVIVVENIDGITEELVAPTTLYDEFGNVAQQNENPSVYKVHFNTGAEICITKETYEKLETKLDIETL